MQRSGRPLGLSAVWLRISVWVFLQSNKKEIDDPFSRQPWCPLIPIPPHGDLIDRDALMGGNGDEWGGMWGYSGAEIMNAPTVIPAEEDDRT